MLKENRIAYGVRVKLTPNFQEKCLGDKYLKEERVLFIRDTKPYQDQKGKYVYISGGSLTTSGYAYLDELELEFEVPESPLKTITMELDKKDLVNLVSGSFVPYELMDTMTEKSLGSYQGGFYDRWVWSSVGLNNLTENELYDVYMILKNSK